ncbi:DUF5107 domain-containing protein [Bacillus kexueae]|uniref:aldose epimerase family protein n=1 Tax=Aeribacillus kexueae TaxID=2078952 RepID=UPI001FAF2BBB|nr:DUF5107 domain-containing protein [Bacillus kexueae]
MIKETVYKGVQALQFENEVIRAIVLPSYGGKLASLFDKKGNYEWLFQAEGELTIPPYGADFSQYDSSGFDEVFPSIDETVHPLNGEVVPDHGEVWAMPWDARLDGETLHLTVQSERFPYILHKTIRLNGESLEISYRAINRGNQPFSFIWTPHALLNLNEHSEIDVPAHLNEIMSVEHSTVHLGEWGTRHSYPMTVSLQTNESIDLSKMMGSKNNTCEKFYFTEKLREGWCKAIQRDISRQLTYEFPVEQVPYLGVWKTQGGYRGDYNFALEPCTGVYDDVYVAEKIRKVSQIPANESVEWFFNMKVEDL